MLATGLKRKLLRVVFPRYKNLTIKILNLQYKILGKIVLNKRLQAYITSGTIFPTTPDRIGKSYSGCEHEQGKSAFVFFWGKGFALAYR